MDRTRTRSWLIRLRDWARKAIHRTVATPSSEVSFAIEPPSSAERPSTTSSSSLNLRASQPDDHIRLLESVVIHARDAVVILQAEPNAHGGRPVLYVNEAFSRMTGYTAEEVVGRSLHFLRGPRSNPETLDQIRDALNAETPLLVELLNYRKDGSEYWVELSLVPVPNAAGHCTHWVMIQRDVSDRKRAEESLRQSEELFRGIFENAAAGVTLTDAQLRFVAVNPAFASIVGQSQEELVGISPASFTHGADWAQQAPLHNDLLAGGREQYQCQKRYVRPDGSEVWTELSVAAVRGPAGEFRYGLGVTVDLTERRRLEDQLRQIQKMESVGQLAGGIAHDFNNLLTGVLGNLALVNLSDDPVNRARVATAERAAHRAAELTRKLLGYARKSQLMAAPLQVADVISEVVDIVRHTLDPRIEIAVELESTPGVIADATLLNQALMNLCLNARDAMAEGGRMTVRAELTHLTPEDAAQNPDARPGTFVLVTVSDTGSGMSPEVRARVFEPFFTTKPVGQGTGLGLAMVHGIVKQHRGWLTCNSIPGEGTRFSIYLPTGGSVGTRWLATERTLPPDLRTPPPAAARSSTILLVDDEELIRELGRSVLESGGYRVLEAEDGAAAVDMFRQHLGAIDLVILDLTMPRVSGRDAYQAMSKLVPDVRVLFSSGYSTDDLSDVGGTLGLLAKPYRPHDLLAAVRRALTERPPGSSPSAVAPIREGFSSPLPDSL